MNAGPMLVRIAAALREADLEAVLIGNAAAALHGAPVTTLDFDFYIRKNPATIRKLKQVAERLQATILKPYYPVSDLLRLVNDDSGLQLDFMATIHGIRSFEALRSRSVEVIFGGCPLRVAALEDVVRSKRAAGRPRDRAVLQILEATLAEKKAHPEAE